MMESGRRDLNPGSLVPQTSALTKLGHVPSPYRTHPIIAQGRRWTAALAVPPAIHAAA